MAITAPGFVTLKPPRSMAQSETAAAEHQLVQSIPRIYGYMYPRVGGDAALAEDLTQETLLAAVRAGSMPASHDQQMPWLFRIARNKLIDHYRAHGRHNQAFGHDQLDPETAPGLPDLDLESLPVREEVIATLATLNPRHRIAIILKYLDGLPTTEVAQAMFLSESATTSLLTRARDAFRVSWIERNGDNR